VGAAEILVSLSRVAGLNCNVVLLLCSPQRM